MPALDDHIDELFDTFFYYVTTPENWEQIREEGIRPDERGLIQALTTNRLDLVDEYARQRYGAVDILVIRFNPCNLGIYPHQSPHDPLLSVDDYITEIRANVIGPLLLEKDCERTLQGT